MKIFEALRGFLRNFGGTGFGFAFARIAAGAALSQFAGMAVATLVGVVLARQLHPEGLGVYSIAMSTVAILAIPTEFGLPNYLMREVAAAHVKLEWGRLAAVLHWCTRAILVSSLAVAAAAAIVASLVPLTAPLRFAVFAALPIVVLSAQTNARDFALRGMNLQLLGQLPTLVLRPIFFLTCLLAFLVLQPSSLTPGTAMLLQTLSMALVAVTAAIIFRRFAPPQVFMRHTGSVSRNEALSASLPMGMTEALRVLNGHMAIFFLGALASTEAVGLFKVADSIGLLCALPISILNVVTAPQIARLHAAGDTERLARLVSYVGLGMALGCFGMFLLVAVFGETILSTLFGAKYVEAKLPMLVLCLGYTIAAAMGPSVAFMNMTGRERTVAQGIAMSFAVNLVVGAAAITYAGAIGAAFANVAGYIIWTAWLSRQSYKLARIDTSLLSALRELYARR
jgi:O-antigen/teichoic acid export membrane protein